MPLVTLTITTFQELANSFGFGVAVIGLLGWVIYKLAKGVIDHLMRRETEKSKAYEDLVERVQEQNKEREAKYEQTVKEITEKSELRDKEHIMIIKNLSENFNVLKDVLVKVEDIETKMSNLK